MEQKYSRQRKWQILQRKKKCCVTCGSKAVMTNRSGKVSAYCVVHLKKRREYSRKILSSKRRNINSFSYQF